MAEVRVSGVSKRFGALTALDEVSIDFTNGEFYGLLGPSGSGKTTLLRVIAGFIYPDAGSVMIGDTPVENVPVEKREIGMVFQNYALFPNMSVAENVAFGLRVRKLPRSEIRQKVSDALDLVQLGDLGFRRPHQLSGGQRQRVALARAIVTQPRVLLLDEPLSALDKALRVDMQIELKRIQREVGITTIFVTHDQEEALTLSDRIGILRDGRLVQQGPPREVYANPVDSFAASFLGEANVFKGEYIPHGIRLGDGASIHWDTDSDDINPPYVLAVRPENITLSTAAPTQRGSLNCLHARLRGKIFAGPTVTCLVDWQDRVLKVFAKASDLENVPDGAEVWISWALKDTIFLPGE